MFKRVLGLVMVGAMSLGMLSCSKDGGGSVEESDIKPRELVKINGDEEYQKFYGEFLKNIRVICEDELNLGIEIDESEVNIFKKDDEDGPGFIDVALTDMGETIDFYVSEEEFTEEAIKLVSEYFDYNLNVEKVMKELKEIGNYTTKDGGSFSYRDGEVSFFVPVVKASNLSEYPLDVYVTKEENEKYNIYNNGKLDKILKDTETDSSYVRVDETEKDLVDDLVVQLESGFTLTHNYEYGEYDAEAENGFFFYGQTIEEAENKFKADDVKKVFKTIFEDDVIYDKVLEYLPKVHESQYNSYDFIVDDLGYFNVGIREDNSKDDCSLSVTVTKKGRVK